ncbi:SGNH hydrolase [Aspergillus campestris IBT 28561]|uniref:SGNH hydrolase n=1 Tax=Aspergillus campestris (strain IBT 28561) TaxID=1392248 RepID=A0A2I1CRA1_ASPC2|nr:SGNH hydrolase [Aspergillus campestris IBT 28561]PKY00153.1 SGNH hydrolase [Aspergillus campestris IBT 28561]
MAPLTLFILLFAFLVNPLLGFAINETKLIHGDTVSSLIQTRDQRVTDLDCVKKWAAVGDSYTAGIGAGSLYRGEREDHACSRYDQSYPVILNRMIGPGVKSFSFKACSGARTADIKEQIRNLDKNMDLVVLTAGGNDLCLSSIISRCILLPLTQGRCHEIISKARDSITRVLVPNVQELLQELEPKMNTDGVVIFVLYAQFFSVENEDCAKYHDWTFGGLRREGFKLSTGRRREFNDLVVDVNNALTNLAEQFRQEDHGFYFRTANWDKFVGDYKGRFCEPGSSGVYPDPAQPNLQFFKHFTKRDLEKDIASKRDLENIIDEPPLARNATMSVPGNSLGLRDNIKPDCPGDDGINFGFGLPDRFGKYFHPNEKGHITIASYVLEAIYAARSAVLGLPQPICHIVDNFQCTVPNERADLDASRRYADRQILHDNALSFCTGITPSGIDWTEQRTFERGTPEEHTFLITTRNGAEHYDQEDCLESFAKIVDSCKSYDDTWKYGGYHEENNHRYQISITNSGHRRLPHGPVKTTCEAKRHGKWTHYKLKGYGGATAGNANRALFPSIKLCVTPGDVRKTQYKQNVRDWNFYYPYDEGHEEDPVPEGYEWQLNFRSPAGYLERCFKSNRVQKLVGLICIFSVALFTIR